MNATNVGDSARPIDWQCADDLDEVGVRVPLLQVPEHLVVERLDRGGHERAAGVAQARQRRGLLPQVLDLDRDVVGDAGKLARQRVDDRQRVSRAVEEVGIAEGDVLRARRHLRADVRQHDVDRHGAEPAVVDRDDRTVPAAMLAPARRLGVADNLARVADLQRRVARQWRQIGPIGRYEFHPPDRPPWGQTFRSGLIQGRWQDARPEGRASGRGRQLRQVGLELRPQDGLHAVRAEDVGVERRVEPVRTDVDGGIQRRVPDR